MEDKNYVELTVKQFQTAYELAIKLKSGQAKKIKNRELVEVISPNNILMWGIKRFVDLNDTLNTKINLKLAEIKLKHVSTDSNGDILYDGDKEKIKPEKQKLYNEEYSNYLEERVKVVTYICPAEKMPKYVPEELETLNGLVLQHNFFEDTY